MKAILAALALIAVVAAQPASAQLAPGGKILAYAYGTSTKGTMPDQYNTRLVVPDPIVFKYILMKSAYGTPMNYFSLEEGPYGRVWQSTRLRRHEHTPTSAMSEIIYPFRKSSDYIRVTVEKAPNGKESSFVQLLDSTGRLYPDSAGKPILDRSGVSDVSGPLIIQ